MTVEGADAAGGARLRVISEGPRARLEEGTARALEALAPENGYDGRSIQPYYTGLIARGNGGRVSAQASEDRVEFIALVKGPEGMIG